MKNNPATGCIGTTVAVIIILTVSHLWSTFWWLLVGVSAMVAALILRDIIAEKYNEWRVKRIIRAVAKRNPDNAEIQDLLRMIEEDEDNQL
jgi:LPS O-antigen subunit length determinant protein (WzzB/FepE family)